MTLRGTDAAEAAGLLGDALVVPVHADSWAHFTESVDDVRTAFEDAGLAGRLQVLAPGVPAALPLEEAAWDVSTEDGLSDR
ncbi:hypothetical protein GCM10025864_16010 [Luteimicrobium album]|uniref:Uncharacterized protein n=1 Tax=Luteimicrobium album TaxID=1054550 RepID=A0ABQ6I071_9MICO|nr:hypothetical protein [Luteimicrobium album]GMA23842.1 hypothetical protein GCM10025864_16010 [Luteimicrobium album]